MGKQKVLSSKFNMSLGYIPVIISIILCEFIMQDIAIYIGTGVGLLFSIYMLQRKGSHVPPIILYCTTGMLLLLTITSFFSTDYCSEAMFPLTLEISAIIPPFVIFRTRSRSCHSICPRVTAFWILTFPYHITHHIFRSSAE